MFTTYLNAYRFYLNRFQTESIFREFHYLRTSVKQKYFYLNVRYLLIYKPIGFGIEFNEGERILRVQEKIKVTCPLDDYHRSYPESVITNFAISCLWGDYFYLSAKLK